VCQQYQYWTFYKLRHLSYSFQDFAIAGTRHVALFWNFEWTTIDLYSAYIKELSTGQFSFFSLTREVKKYNTEQKCISLFYSIGCLAEEDSF
jgi:hypothetical protein